MKNTFFLFSVIAFFAFQNNSDWDVKLGDPFDKWKDKFTLQGISSRSGNKYYDYNKKISTSVYNHTIDKMFITVNNNTVIAYSFILFPNSEDVGVPKTMIEKFKQQSGFDLQYKDGSYSFKVPGKIAILIDRKNTSSFGDRITIFTTSDTN